MGKFYNFLMGVFLIAIVFLPQLAGAQSPEKMSYQAVIRNSSDELVTNAQVGMQISILQGSINGTPVYVETQMPTSNANGLVSFEIGSINATVVSGDFSTIDWANSIYFIKTETDLTGGTAYTISGTSQLLSVPYALHAKSAENVTGILNETDPEFTAWDKSTGITIVESQISDLNHFTSTDETDPVFDASTASGITSQDTTNWNNKLDRTIYNASTASGITSQDTTNWNNKLDRSIYNASTASGITSQDTTNWNNKLDRSIYSASTASGITSQDTTNWNNKLDRSIYNASTASGITSQDTTNWNNKLDRSIYNASTASGITSQDTTNWNNKLDRSIYNASTASGITSQDTTNWNNKLDRSIYNASTASGITSDDTTYWNAKSEFDGDFSSLYNAPNIANTTFEKKIQLNTNDATSNVNITKNNGASVLKVDGTGRITGDGSGLSNVKPLLNYIGGDQRYQITANYGTYNNVRSVTMTAPSNGVCFVMASGYIDWESTGWDLLLAGILCDMDPNSSWSAENEWYQYLNIITDYNCADSSDQYTSFSQHRCIPVSAGTHTFYLWANKYTSASKTEVGDVNLSVMFFPVGGTGKSPNEAMIKEEEPFMVKERVPNTVAGYK